MKIRLEQLNPTIGDLKGNYSLIAEAITQADKDGIELLVLPEMVTCGYPPMDLVEYEDFRDSVYRVNKKIVEQSGSTAVLFGTITPNEDSGRACFNSALFVQNGKVLSEVHKTLLPTYDVYDEHRYFEPNDSFKCIEFKGQQIGVTVCEDVWHNFDLSYLSYGIDPVERLAKLGAEALFNVSASPYTREKPRNRQKLLEGHAQKWSIPVFYANQVGANTELLSDGDSMAIDGQGKLVGRTALFEEGYIDLFWDAGQDSLENIGPSPAELPMKIEQIFKGLVMGLRDYLVKTGITDKVVIGLSGGIDSALVAALAVEALGAESVVGITMPSEFSSAGSIDDSKKLADNLGIAIREVAIKDIYDQFNDSLQPLFEGTSFGVAEENLQTRIRGLLLMAYSNKFGHMLLNTGNKSELATGYCTLYGDMSGGLGIIADLYKNEVYEMAHWLNNEYFNKEIIPSAILSKPPSAELRPDQKDADSLPAYDILDPILEAYIEDQCSIQEIVDQGFDREVVKRVTDLVDRMEYKRFQAVPALKISDKAFGTGRRWPMVQKWTSNRP